MANSRRGDPVVYVGALMLIGLMLGPVLYIIVGGFRTNSQITTDPAGLPVAERHGRRRCVQFDSNRFSTPSRPLKFRATSACARVAGLAR